MAEEASPDFFLCFLEGDYDGATEIVLSNPSHQDLFCRIYSTEATNVKDKVKSLAHEEAAYYTVQVYLQSSSLHSKPKRISQTLFKAIHLGLNDTGLSKYIEGIEAFFCSSSLSYDILFMLLENMDDLNKVLSLLKKKGVATCFGVTVLPILLRISISWSSVDKQMVYTFQQVIPDLDTIITEGIRVLGDHFLTMCNENNKQKDKTSCSFCGKALAEMEYCRRFEDCFFKQICSHIYSQYNKHQFPSPNRQRCVFNLLKSVLSTDVAANICGPVARQLMEAVIHMTLLDDEYSTDLVIQIINTHKYKEDFTDGQQHNVVMHAAGSLRCKLLKYLHKFDDSPKLSDFGPAKDTGDTPLMHLLSNSKDFHPCMEQQFLDTLSFILQIPETNVSAINKNGMSAFTVMICGKFRENVKVLELLTQKNINISRNEYSFFLGQLQYTNVEMFTQLLQYQNFDVNYHLPESGLTMLMVAASTNSNLLRILLENARVDKMACCKNGKTCLFYSCMPSMTINSIQNPLYPSYNRPECLKSFEMLLNHKDIDPNHIDADKQTVLQHILGMENRDERKCYLKLLLGHSNLNNLNFQDRNRDTALHLMIEYKEYNVVQKVLEYKTNSEHPINFDTQNNNNRDVIDELFILTSDTELCPTFKLVTDQPNVPINYRFAGKQTLLMKACVHGCDPVTAFLLQMEGIDLNLQDDLGYTAIMYAITRLQYDTVVKFLLKSDCDLKIKNNKGEDLQELLERDNVPPMIRDTARIAIVRSDYVPSVSFLAVEEQIKLVQDAVRKDDRFIPHVKEHLMHGIQFLETDLRTFSAGRYGHDLSMSKEHNDKLRGCRVYICDELIPDPIFAYLVQDGVLNDDIVEDIRQAKTRRKMSEKLLSILPLRGPKAYDSFIEGLMKEQPYIAETIEQYDPEQHDGTSSQLVPRQKTDPYDLVPVMMPRQFLYMQTWQPQL